MYIPVESGFTEEDFKNASSYARHSYRHPDDNIIYSRLLPVICTEVIFALVLYCHGLFHGRGNIIDLEQWHKTLVVPRFGDRVPFRLNNLDLFHIADIEEKEIHVDRITGRGYPDGILLIRVKIHHAKFLLDIKAVKVIEMDIDGGIDNSAHRCCCSYTGSERGAGCFQ